MEENNGLARRVVGEDTKLDTANASAKNHQTLKSAESTLVMDARANTLLCLSPALHSEPDTPPESASSAYIIVVAGGIPGTMARLSPQGMSLGRSAENAFQITHITVSRQHAFVSIDEAGEVQLRDEGSTNGTLVNGKRIARHRTVGLGDGDRIQLGSHVVLKVVRLDANDEKFQREMFERTVRDALTGLYNRAYFLSQIGLLAERSSAQGNGLAVLMVDVDHFKRINDGYGHLAGDAVLKEIAAVIRESTRSEDLVARFGGEEFVVALPVSVPERAVERAERIRSNIAVRRIAAEGQQVRVTASIGLAYAPPGRTRGEMALIMTADEALYRAKAEGRNRIVFGHHSLQLAPKQTESAEFASIV
jgi:diguanylate cyclase (GGDEF)-like protein